MRFWLAAAACIVAASALPAQERGRRAPGAGPAPGWERRLPESKPPRAPRATPVPDARLGAGSITTRPGNIVFPGTPDSRNVADILSPGLPRRLPRPDSPPPPPVDAVFVPVYIPVPVVEPELPGTVVKPRAQHYIVEAPTNGRFFSSRPESDGTTLIALEGGLIYAVDDYSVDPDTIRFTTTRGDTYVVSLRELDLELTEQLNEERGVRFTLARPAPEF